MSKVLWRFKWREEYLPNWWKIGAMIGKEWERFWIARPMSSAKARRVEVGGRLAYMSARKSSLGMNRCGDAFRYMIASWLAASRKTLRLAPSFAESWTRTDTNA